MSSKIKTITISKLFFLAYVVYNNVLIYSLMVFKGFSTLLIIAALFFQLFSDRYKIFKERSFISYLIFFIYILLTGLLVSVDRDRMLQTAFTFLEYLLSYYLIISYARADHKIDFPINVFVLQGIIASLVMVIRGVSSLGMRASIADNVNSNIIAVTLAFTIAFIKSFATSFCELIT